MEAEARRCIDMGLKGFVLPDTPERSACRASCTITGRRSSRCATTTGTPLNFHLNAAIDPNTLTWEGFAVRADAVGGRDDVLDRQCRDARQLDRQSGRLDQFPKLKIGLIESGMGWVPFALEALEHQFDEMLPR